MPESHRHLELRTALYEILKLELGHHATVGSDQFVYWDPSDPGQRLAPDVFVFTRSRERCFDSWKVWQRGAPEVCVEIVSDSDARIAAWDVKFERYRKVGVQELVRFDPDAPAERALSIWDNVGGDLALRVLEAPEDSVSFVLSGLFWCVVPDAEGATMLRLARDAHHNVLLPTPNEARESAERRVRELEAELRRRG